MSCPSGAAKGDDLYWNGYKVHITETCDTPTPVPAEHYLDSGYPSAALVVDSLRRWGITLVSSLLADQSRQARTGAGSDRAGFTIDFDTQQARCPQGKTSTWWSPATQRGTDAIVIKFAADTCRACSTRPPGPSWPASLLDAPVGEVHLVPPQLPIPADTAYETERRAGVSRGRLRSARSARPRAPSRTPRTGRPCTPGDPSEHPKRSMLRSRHRRRRDVDMSRLAASCRSTRYGP
ncbi:MAG: hypothetical protein LC799_13170, partial [Actinobacteria bacterium]|nr:hypothetical protein [Actinomycetota bacterium]